jgi:cell division transport system ATP-binding protein
VRLLILKFHEEKAIFRVSHKENIMEASTIISLKDITAFHRKKLVLDKVSLEVKKGEFVYIIGKTGSGKSSLLKTLYKELEIAEGQAKILDFDLKNIKSSKVPLLRRSLGIVFQDFQLLFDRSVEDNLLFVMKSTGWKAKGLMQKQVDETLEQVGLIDVNNKFPHQLSGGEQQRVVIARAMINSPKVILADEPTGNLDPESSKEIMNILTKISKTGTAVIMATHDMDIVSQFPSRTLVCENGILTEQLT